MCSCGGRGGRARRAVSGGWATKSRMALAYGLKRNLKGRRAARRAPPVISRAACWEAVPYGFRLDANANRHGADDSEASSWVGRRGQVRSGRRGSNPRKPRLWESRALPTELLPRAIHSRATGPFAPGELLSRATAMTVHAADVAFVDLRPDAHPAAPMDKRRHRGNFLRRIPVVEFEDHRIPLATGDAGVRAEVPKQLPPVLE